MLTDQNGRLVMTKDNWAALVQINNEGNKVRWTSDKQVWGVVEKWDFPRDSGRTKIEDCDGITLYKLKLLMEAGFPQGVLLFTICKCETGEGHAVLCVTTDRGDFILDNRFQKVMAWDDLSRKGYHFLYRTRINGKMTDPWQKIV